MKINLKVIFIFFKKFKSLINKIKNVLIINIIYFSIKINNYI